MSSTPTIVFFFQFGIGGLDDIVLYLFIQRARFCFGVQANFACEIPRQIFRRFIDSGLDHFIEFFYVRRIRFIRRCDNAIYQVRVPQCEIVLGDFIKGGRAEIRHRLDNAGLFLWLYNFPALYLRVLFLIKFCHSPLP